MEHAIGDMDFRTSGMSHPFPTCALPVRDGETLDVILTNGSFLARYLADWVRRRVPPGRVVHTLNLAHWDACRRSPEYLRVYRSADFIIADGWPIARACARLHGDRVERVAGADLVPRLLPWLPTGSRVFLLGTREDWVRIAARRVTAEYPHLGAVDAFHGFFRDDDEVVHRINRLNPDLLLVGMGSPRQETWLYQRRGDLRFTLAVCVGGLLDLLAGRRRRAPEWIRRLRLEWLYRWGQNPAGMTRRYFIEGPPAYLALRREIRRQIRHKSRG